MCLERRVLRSLQSIRKILRSKVIVMKKYMSLFWVAFIILVLDQASKFWILSVIEPGTYFDPAPIPVIENFFYIVHVYNTGAAWSLFAGGSFWLGLLAIGVIVGIFLFRKQLELERPAMQYGIGFLVGGVIGNLIDRFHYGHVIDFIDIHLPGYRWPAFNVADSAIFVGVVIYLGVIICDSLKKETTKKLC